MTVRVRDFAAPDADAAVAVMREVVPYLGRGLATLAKRESLRRAREAGYRIAYTANAPMIAVNDKLGYRYAATRWRYCGEVATSAS